MEFLFLKRNTRLVILLFILFVVNSEAQSLPREYPKIGDTCPAFLLKDLRYYSKTQGSSADFRGRPIILDFFSEGCKACFLSFPHVDSMKKEFGGKVQFILVGKMSSGLVKQYENYMKHYGLDLPVDYDDSTIWNQFGVMAVPYTVWVDGDGIIRQTTSSYSLTPERIRNFMNGISQSLTVSINQHDGDNWDRGIKWFDNFYDQTKPLLVNGNGGNDSSFLCRSLISNWDYRTESYRDFFISSKNKNWVQEIGVNLDMLFNFAYGDTVTFLTPRSRNLSENTPNHYGQWAPFPVVESKRSALFSFDYGSGKNLFSYSMIIQDTSASAQKLQRIMQRDLEDYFSLKATVETRKMPCWKIIADKNAEKILKTKGGVPEWSDTFSGFRFKNQPVYSLILEIWTYFQRQPIIFDETGINYNIDIKVNAVLTDVNEIKKELQKNGLDLVNGEKEMKVIVVRDSKD